MFDQKDKFKQLLVDCGSNREEVSAKAQRDIAIALQEPVRRGIQDGSIIENIFERDEIMLGGRADYPTDFLNVGETSEFKAYTIPDVGYIPQRHVSSKEVVVPTFTLGDSIDFALKFMQTARFDVVAKALEKLAGFFVAGLNESGFQTIIAAGEGRGVMANDSNAASGQFTKELIDQMILTMRRNNSGNSATMNRGQLTHLYISPEASSDMRQWGVNEVDEVTRREIYTDTDGMISQIYGVNLVDLDELGVNQTYQNYFDNQLNGSMASGDEEIVIGLDLSNRNSFVMPVEEDLQIHEDTNMHRERRVGFYGWQTQGFGVLDDRRVLLGSL